MDTTQTKDLQAQWAGGKDVWPAVPVVLAEVGNTGSFVHVETKPKSNANDQSTDEWPKVVRESVLFGVSAYNPRGTIVADELNRNQNDKMQQELQQMFQGAYQTEGTYWIGIGVWEDGSQEPGFIVAFFTKTYRPSKHKEYVIDLAKRYEQGAIYEFHFHDKDNKLIRSTVPVLNPGTEADVEVVLASKRESSAAL